MKLVEVINTPQTPEYKLFVDLDGVLVDFVELAKKWVPNWKEEGAINRNKKLDRELWGRVGGRAKKGIPFWGQMKPMPDASQLWSYVKKYNPEILSATGRVGNPIEEKKEWVRKYLGPNVKVNLVQRAVDKAQFAAPGHILIDDKIKAINPWIEAGGIGIHHTSAVNTIARLKELGL